MVTLGSTNVACTIQFPIPLKKTTKVITNSNLDVLPNVKTDNKFHHLQNLQIPP